MSENKNLLLIGATARQAGISSKSLQNYVKLGLIEPKEVTETGGDCSIIRSVFQERTTNYSTTAFGRKQRHYR